MAIQQTVEFKGILVTDAYIRIESAKVLKRNGIVICWLQVQKKANVNSEPIEQFELEFELDLNGANALVQGYTHLKTLPSFSDAIDV